MNNPQFAADLSIITKKVLKKMHFLCKGNQTDFTNVTGVFVELFVLEDFTALNL